MSGLGSTWFVRFLDRRAACCRRSAVWALSRERVCLFTSGKFSVLGGREGALELPAFQAIRAVWRPVAPTREPVYAKFPFMFPVNVPTPPETGLPGLPRQPKPSQAAELQWESPPAGASVRALLPLTAPPGCPQCPPFPTSCAAALPMIGDEKRLALAAWTRSSRSCQSCRITVS